MFQTEVVGKLKTQKFMFNNLLLKTVSFMR